MRGGTIILFLHFIETKSIISNFSINISKTKKKTTEYHKIRYLNNTAGFQCQKIMEYKKRGINDKKKKKVFLFFKN